MKSRTLYSAIAALVFATCFVQTGFAQIIPNLGSQRAGTAMGAFLKIGVGARAVGMGESFVAVANDASALYWNPAGITQIEKNEVVFSHTEFTVDLKHEFFGYVHKLGRANTLGLSITSVSTDDFEETTEFQPLGTGNFVSFGDLAVGLTFARKMTDRFSIGVAVKYIDETLDVLHARNLFVDFGTFFWTGLGSSRFAVSVANFGTNMEPSGTVTDRSGNRFDDFQDFSPPTIFRIGFATEVVDNESHRVTTSVQLNHLNDNAENFSFGTEYLWQELLSLRAGYRLNVDEESFAFGGGLAIPLKKVNLNLDFSYSDFGRLGSASRLTAVVGF